MHRFMLQPVKKVRADLKKGRSDKEDKIRAIQNQVHRLASPT